jgi:sporulation protein YqfC
VFILFFKDFGLVFSKLFGIPADIAADLPGFSMIGRNDLLVRNYGHLVEFTDSKMIINKSDGLIAVEGKKLRLSYISNEELMLNGLISSINFVSRDV